MSGGASWWQAVIGGLFVTLFVVAPFLICAACVKYLRKRS